MREFCKLQKELVALIGRLEQWEGATTAMSATNTLASIKQDVVSAAGAA
jgi:hypothetical protein